MPKRIAVITSYSIHYTKLYEIAELYTKAFLEDLEKLNILEPTTWCKATEHIQEQIALVQCIEDKGFAYRTLDGIYFDTSLLDNYGYLGRLDIQGLQAGARVDVAEKRNPTDFSLWKFSPVITSYSIHYTKLYEGV